MLVSDVLRIKGREVLKIRATDPVDAAVHRLVERRIGALVVEDQWMRLVGLFSERDFVKAIARHGPAVLDWEVQKLMTSPIVSCRSSSPIDISSIHISL